MRFIRSVVAVLMFAAMVVVSQASVASAAGPVYTGPPPTVDGFLDPLYESSFSTIDYTQTGTTPHYITGQIAVIETADAYYIGFQQSLKRQTNSYCANTSTCERQFNELVGSDHISFQWPNLGGKAVTIGVDILSANSAALYGYSGTLKTGNLGDGLTLAGCPATAVTAFSGMDYNWHHAGGTGYGAEAVATSSSPDHAGLTAKYPDYVYASTAEVKIDKVGCGLGGGLDLAGTASVSAHNSPALTTQYNPPEFLACVASNPTTGTLGVESTLNVKVVKFDANLNPIPSAGRTVVPSIFSGPGSITSVNTNAGATKGVSDANGIVAVGVTSQTQGTTQIEAWIDGNNDGVQDFAVEPSVICGPIEFSGTPPDMKITKTADVTSVNAPGSITYTMTARNAGGSPATGVVVSDDLDNDLIITSATWQVGGGGASGNCTFTAGNVLSCAVGTLAPDDNAAGGPDTATISVTVTAPPAACPKVTNQAHVTATNEATGQQTDTQANPTEDNWSLPVDVLVNCGPPGITVDLIKTNNADGVGGFTKSEVAPAQNATVPFHLEIRNTSTVPIKITALTDTWPGHAVDDLTSKCATSVVGQTLAPYVAANSGPVLICDFSETGYAPAPGAAAKVNTAHVDAVNPNDAAQTAFDEDTSAVTVNPVGPTPITVDLIKTNNADGVGGFTKSEVAPAQNATVPFHLEIRNTSTVMITIDHLTDTWPGRGVDDLDLRCSSAVGQTLLPYTLANGWPVLTCDFNETSYAPAPGAAAKVNTAHVAAHSTADPTQTATDDDTSAVTVNPVNPTPITVDLIKTNDANGDASFNKSEIAPAQGATVPFHLEIRNTSTVPIRITGLTDTWPGHGVDNLATVCAGVVGQTLAPYVAGVGPVLTCDFNEPSYAPAPGAAAKVNTAVVSAENPADTTQTATDDDTSAVTVNPVNPPVITVELVKTNDASGDGVYNDSEMAPAQDATVPFRALIHNTSSVAVRIDSITDVWDGHPAALDICDGVTGSNLLNVVLQPDGQAGDRVTCSWSLDHYAPAPGAGAKIDTAEVGVSQVGDPTNTAFDQDTSAVTSPAQGITVDLVKTNDADADGVYHDSEVAPAEGATVPFRAVITNTSNVAVQLLTLTDEFPNHAASGICSTLVNAPTVLQPGDQAICEWQEPAYAWASNLGAKVNIARVTVGEVGNLGNTAEASDPSAVTSPGPPTITVALVKTNDADADGVYHDSEVAPAQGADVPFKAVFTNTSTVAVRIDQLTDLLPGSTVADNICTALIGTTLQPGGSATCTWTEPGYAGPAGAGAKVNVAAVKVSQVGNPNNTATAQDPSTVTTTPTQISVTLVKTNDADGDSSYHDAEVAPTVGADVPFKAVFTNTSNVAVRVDQLTDLLPGSTVADNICAALIGTVLQPGDSATCTWTEPHYSGPASAGAKVNTATVKVSEVGHPSNTATSQDTSVVTTAPSAISVTLVKDNDANRDASYHDAEVAPVEGADVPFRAVITNTSNVAVRIDQLTDLLPGSTVADNICANLIGTVLQPGDSATCTWTEPGYAGAPDASAKVNTAAVKVSQVGDPSKTAVADDTSSVTTAPAQISVTLVKDNDANDDGTYHDSEVAPAEGAEVPFRVVITNTSNVAVRIDQLTDLLPGHATADNVCANLIGTVLQPGDSATCTWTEPGYAGAPDAAAKVNTATVKVSQVGHPDKTATANDTSSVTTTTSPPPVLSISVVKTNNANGDTVYSDDETGTTGASVPFRAVITNTSTVPVVIDSITDVWPGATALDECASLIGTTLQPGASVTCEFTVANYVPAAADGAKVDTVTVKAHQAGNPNNTTSANDVSTVRGAAAPAAVLGETVVRAPTLPRTGSDSNVGLGVGLGLIGLGSMLVLAAHGSRRLPYAAPSAPVFYNIRLPVIERNSNAWTTHLPGARNGRRR